MKNIVLVMSREYLTQVRKKSFIIMTILAPILIILAGVVITYMITANETRANVAVIDASQQFSTSFKSDKENIYNFYSENELPALKDSLLKGKTIDAVLYIPKAENPDMSDLTNKIRLYTNKNLGKSLILSIKQTLNKKIEEKQRILLGIKESDIQKLNANVSLLITNLKDGQNDSGSWMKDILALTLMYVVFMFIIIYGTRVMRSVMEEKNNRVVEIIISSVKPFDLMMGKILGTTLVALTQFCIWIAMTMILLVVGQVFLGQELMMTPTVSQDVVQEMMNHETQLQIKNSLDSLLSLNAPLIIFVFLFYFFTGYLFYSSFFASIGAAVESDTETQQFMPVVLIPSMLGAYGCIGIISNPEGPVAFWLSMIPFTSPMAMVTRIPYGVPAWQLLLSVAIMIGSVILMVYIAGKIYRVGILMYGKKVSFKELAKWIKQS
ncbi:MAG: ABC transporter permease [Flavobacteriaceae bacterium]|jgi:ABC-2 type transport system permease protein|nr:ABC transporter permease [Flavobacteriaceae bacterium]